MPIYKIQHPKADEISVQDSQYHMCRPGKSAEIAFFLDNQWVIEPIEPFADYHDGSKVGSNDTAVYGFVPNDLIRAFLDENAAVLINR